MQQELVWASGDGWLNEGSARQTLTLIRMRRAYRLV